MRVIGVDPGYDRIGIAVLEFDKDGKEKNIFSTCIITDKKSDLSSRLLDIGKTFTSIVDEYKPQALAIETLFFNTNQKTAIAVGAARGVIMYLAKAAGCQVYEYNPQEIKVAITGYGKSDKRAVIDMVGRLVKDAPLKGLDDEYDAIAVAVTHLASCGR